MNEEIPKASKIQIGNIKKESEKEDFELDTKRLLEKVNVSLSSDEAIITEEQQNTVEENSTIVKKYNIIDLVWLNKFEKEKILENKNECNTLTISYNYDFGNLRLVFGNTNKIYKNGIRFKSEIDKKSIATMYVESCYEFLYKFKYNRGEKINIKCLENLINDTGEDWIKNRTLLEIKMDESLIENSIVLRATNYINNEKDSIYYYVLKDWQFNLFIDCVKFCVKEKIGEFNI